MIPKLLRRLPSSINEAKGELRNRARVEDRRKALVLQGLANWQTVEALAPSIVKTGRMKVGLFEATLEQMGFSQGETRTGMFAAHDHGTILVTKDHYIRVR